MSSKVTRVPDTGRNSIAAAHDMADFVCNMQKSTNDIWLDSNESKEKAKKEDLNAAETCAGNVE